MKHIFLFLPIFLFSLTATAQVPSHFVYNLVVRDSADLEVKNDTVSVEVSIVRDSAMGQSQYSEVHTAVTTVSGLVSLEVGTGTDTSGNLSAINWKAGPYYLQTRTDVAGGTNYGPPTAIEMVSVPYALYSNRSDTAHTASFTDTLAVSVSKEGDTLFLGTAGQYVVIPGLSEANPSSECLQDTTEVVEVISTTGRIWMDRNLGAFQAADSSADSRAYGDLYQWGRSADGHQCRDSDTTSTLASTAASSPDSAWYGKFIITDNDPYDWLSTQDSNLWQGVNGVNNPCPTGFRLPTETEWQAEIDEWGGDKNATGAYNSPLKLPVSGNRLYSVGLLSFGGMGGLYWSSSVSGSQARYLNFTSSNADFYSNNRAFGYAVRCIKEIPAITGCELDTTAVVEVVSAEGRIWMDRNLGAARAAVSSDDSLAYGALYQWGRAEDGHQCRNSDTTSTKATTAVISPDSAWHGKFIVDPITSPFFEAVYWLSTQDDNLWQGVNGVNNPCPTGFRIPTASEWETELDSWGQDANRDSAFNSPLKLVVSSRREGNNGVQVLSGLSQGYYWSSSFLTPLSGQPYRHLNPRGLLIGGSVGMSIYSRADGQAVRCIKELPPATGCEDSTAVVEVTSTTSRVWMDRNLGAFRKAISGDDSLAFGALYQWGRAADGYQCRNSETTSTLATTVVPSTGGSWDGKFITANAPSNDWLSTPDSMLWQGIAGVNNPCPEGFRLPTQSEWQNERDSWGGNKWASDAFDSPLKLPVTGHRNQSSGNIQTFEYGYYWSSTVSTTQSMALSIFSSGSQLDPYNRIIGHAVRCIKHVYPPVTGCELNETAVMEVTSAGGQVWMDRNLGAYRAAKSSDDTLAYGALYQWGRGADGHQCRDNDTTSTQASTSIASTDQAWAGKFIVSSTSPFDWLSPQDSNLWQGVNGVNNPCPTGFRLPTETEWQAEIDSWGNDKNATGAHNSPLKLPVSGLRLSSSGAPFFVGSVGYYWSSSVSGSDARYLYINSSGADLSSNLRASGSAVRCLKEE